MSLAIRKTFILYKRKFGLVRLVKHYFLTLATLSISHFSKGLDDWSLAHKFTTNVWLGEVGSCLDSHGGLISQIGTFVALSVK